MRINKLSIIIPAFNEEQNIESILRKIEKVDFGGVQKEVIIVDDGSKDGTRPILKNYEDGKFVPAKDLNKVKKDLRKVVKNTLDKTKNINIRITQKVLYKLRKRAIEEGIPYQTLVSSVLHKYVSQ